MIKTSSTVLNPALNQPGNHRKVDFIGCNGNHVRGEDKKQTSMERKFEKDKDLPKKRQKNEQNILEYHQIQTDDGGNTSASHLKGGNPLKIVINPL